MSYEPPKHIDPFEYKRRILSIVDDMADLDERYPHVVPLPEDGVDLVLLSTDHYLIIEKDAVTSNVRHVHEVRIESGEYRVVPHSDSLFGIAKKLRAEQTEEQTQYTQRLCCKVGLSEGRDPIVVGGRELIFMKKIDDGYTLADAINHIDQYSITEILQCMINAMRYAVYLRDVHGIVHMDLNEKNVLFPSGVCIDLEYSAELQRLGDDDALMPKHLGTSEEVMPDIEEDLGIPSSYIRFKDDRLHVNKYCVDYQFAVLLQGVICQREAHISQELQAVLDEMSSQLEKGCRLEDVMTQLEKHVMMDQLEPGAP